MIKDKKKMKGQKGEIEKRKIGSLKVLKPSQNLWGKKAGMACPNRQPSA